MLRGGKGADGIKNKLKYQHNMVENPGPLVDINQNAASTFENGK